MPVDKDKIYPTGIVYKLHHRTDDLGNNFYIGSTVDEKKRIESHIRRCRNQFDSKHNYIVYKFIREYGGFDVWTFTTIKEYENISIRELERCEQQARDELQPTLNKLRSGLPFNHLRMTNKKLYDKLYRQENHEKIHEVNKQYRQENHEKILAKAKEKFTCECGSIVRYDGKYHHMKTTKHKNFIQNKMNTNSITECKSIDI